MYTTIQEEKLTSLQKTDEISSRFKLYRSVEDWDKMKYYAKIFYTIKFKTVVRELLARDFKSAMKFETTSFEFKDLNPYDGGASGQFTKLWMNRFLANGFEGGCMCTICSGQQH